MEWPAWLSEPITIGHVLGLMALLLVGYMVMYLFLVIVFSLIRAIDWVGEKWWTRGNE